MTSNTVTQEKMNRLFGMLDHAPIMARDYSAVRTWLASLSDETTAKCAKPNSHHPACNCLEREARDAARYRFLRQPGNAIIYAKDRDAWGEGASGHVKYDTAAQLDAAVDAAMGSPVNGNGDVP